MRSVLLFVIVALFAISCGESTDSKVDSVKKDSTPKAPVRIDSTRKGLDLPKSMYVNRKTAYDNFYIRYGDSMYYCGYKGQFEVADSLGNHKRALFNLDAEYLIDAIYLYKLTPVEFFVAWQETDHRGVHSYFARYREGESKPKWRLQIDAPSPGQPVVDSQYVYISTLGMVAKLNLADGKAVWRNDSLFDPYRLTFKRFDKPIIYNQSVCFFDFSIKGKKNKRDTIWVDDRTGAMR